MVDHFYDPVGRCIYCGTDELPAGVARFTDEHIIPLALGGNLVLQEASCKKCATVINRQIETPILSHEWGDLRAKRKFPSRNKKPKRTYITATGNDGSPIKIPLSDHSTPVLLYKFSEARILCGLPRTVDDLRWTADILASHEEEVAMQTKYPNWNKQHRLMARPYPFARLLAKIAHGYAVAEYGESKLGSFKPLCTEIIRGLSDDYFYTVGGTFDIPDPIPNGDHVTDISLRFVDPKRALLRVDIRLFSKIRMPAYHVIVGEVDLDNPKHVRVLDQHRLHGKIKYVPFAF